MLNLPAGLNNNLYIGLFNSDIYDGQPIKDIKEVSGSGYSRALLKVEDVEAQTGNGFSASVVFPAATGSWGQVVSWAMFFQEGGFEHMIAFGRLAKFPGNTVLCGDTVNLEVSHILDELHKAFKQAPTGTKEVWYFALRRLFFSEE